MFEIKIFIMHSYYKMESLIIKIKGKFGFEVLGRVNGKLVVLLKLYRSTTVPNITSKWVIEWKTLVVLQLC